MSNILNIMKNTLLLAVGTVSLVLGVVGVILPLIPGTPFLIVAFFCFKTLFESQPETRTV